jgi:hypothetical protein
MIERLDAIGVGEITMPSHVHVQRRTRSHQGVPTPRDTQPLVAKGPGVRPPLRGDWKAVIDRHIDLGTEVISPIFKWSYDDTIGDFSGALGKKRSSTRYTKASRT